MKKWMLFALCLLLPLCAAAETAYYIDGKTADRVHLRAEPSVQAPSLGLYFTGTPVEELPAYFRTEWMHVRIGAAEGYIHRDYVTAKAPASAARAAVVDNPDGSGWLHLRQSPSLQSGSLGRYDNGNAVQVLGETADGWSYVRAGTLVGYMMTDRLSYMPGEAFPSAAVGTWIYASGAGAWRTVLTVLPDGTFNGYYSDSEMGEAGAAYPNGTRYESLFQGRFGAFDGRLMVQSLQVTGDVGSERIEDGVRVVTSAPAGLALGNTLTVRADGLYNTDEDALFRVQ